MATRKKGAEKSRSRLGKVFYHLKNENPKFTQTQFAEKLGYELSNVNPVINDKEAIRPGMLIRACEVYPQYSLFLLGLVKDLKDEASVILDDLHRIFNKITTTPKKYDVDNGKDKKRNDTDREIESAFLMLSMDKSLYDFLVEYDRVKKFEEQGLESFSTEMTKIGKRFIESRGKSEPINCVLIPSNALRRIVEFNKHSQQVMDEIISIGTDISVYLDEDSKY